MSGAVLAVRCVVCRAPSSEHSLGGPGPRDSVHMQGLGLSVRPLAQAPGHGIRRCLGLAVKARLWSACPQRSGWDRFPAPALGSSSLHLHTLGGGLRARTWVPASRTGDLAAVPAPSLGPRRKPLGAFGAPSDGNSRLKEERRGGGRRLSLHSEYFEMESPRSGFQHLALPEFCKSPVVPPACEGPCV